MSRQVTQWAKKTLGEVGKWSSGGTPKRTNSDYYDGDIPWLVIGDLNDSYVTSSKNTITEYGLKNSSAKLVDPNTLLVAMYGSIGKLGINTMTCTTNQAIAACKVDDNQVTLKFLFYYLMSKRKQLLSLGKGGAQQNISQTVLKAFEVIYPELSEQKLITQKLDSVLGRLESAQSRLERVPQILKRFRMSVLSAAVSGELTEEWRDANNMDDWAAIKVTNIVEKIEAGKNLKCHERPPHEDELGIVKISAVTWGIYDEEESKTLPDSSLFLENRRINVGDFLISRANTLELLGMPVIVHQVTKNLMLSDKVWRIVAEDADKQWLSIFLRSPEGRKQIESRATGNQESMRNIAQKAFLDIDLPMPSPEEKEAIVSIVNGLFNKADLVEKQYLVAKQLVDKLTQSILARAFRGELFEPFTDTAERVAQPQSSDVVDGQPTERGEAASEQVDIIPTRNQPTPKAVDDKSELLSKLRTAKQAMSAQQLFDSASVETFKAIDDLFVELKRLLELNLIEKVGEGENCQFKATK
ncbi:restriction endonuclease subunit S [Vibrio vulnificus]|uniref:restriction endonuclease subunit S n=1 Tax=Vibrio vulnificus TaxID=672 RepID=UPI0040591EAE